MLEYRDEWLNGLPEEAIESFAGTGNPFSFGELRPSNRVVDAGCGAGLDSLIAANMMGRGGEVIGVDMTKEMIDKASSNAQAIGAKNISFRQGVIEDLPVEGRVGRCCYLKWRNQSGARQRRGLFARLNRVLKPGGWLQIADILVEKPIPDSAKRNIDLWTG